MLRKQLNSIKSMVSFFDLHIKGQGNFDGKDYIFVRS